MVVGGGWFLVSSPDEPSPLPADGIAEGPSDINNTKSKTAQGATNTNENDGDEDILLGNWGWNSKFHPSKTHPLYGFAEDFDDNGSTDFVLSVKYKDQLVPVRGKECSSQQMPFIVDSFPSYMDFAQSTLDDIYGADQTASSYKVSATNFSSSILIQESPGTWRLEKLSPEYQISCIQDACSYDFDQDGMTDWVVAGNKSQTEVETTPLDASIGLLAHGKKNSPPQTELSSDRSGIFIPGDLRAMQIIHLGEERVPCILAAKNNSRLNLLLYGGE